MLQVDPKNRPNCDQILNNPMIIKRMDYGKNSGKAQYNLIGTIKMPRNMNEINQKLPQGNFGKNNKYIPYNISIVEEPGKKRSNEYLIKVEEDPYIREIKSNQNKEANVQQQPILKRPDSAKYLPPQKADPPKQNYIMNNQPNNNINKPNPQPVIKNNTPVINNNNNLIQKPQNILSNNANNNILMRNDKPQQPAIK